MEGNLEVVADFLDVRARSDKIGFIQPSWMNINFSSTRVAENPCVQKNDRRIDHVFANEGQSLHWNLQLEFGIFFLQSEVRLEKEQPSR